jgi:hypothetical protein
MQGSAMIRTFAARLLCPHCDASSWLTLSNREESYDTIRAQTFAFKCREHGPQQGTPAELLEVAPLDQPVSTQKERSGLALPVPAAPKKRIQRSSVRLAIHTPVVVYGFAAPNGSFKETSETIVVNSSGALVILKAKLSVGDSVFLIDKTSGIELPVRVAYVERYSDRESRVGLGFKESRSNFWRRARKKPRVPVAMRVVVKGKDSQGRAFSQSAFTVDLSQDGARLEGVAMMASSGQTLQVRRLWRKANFRVVWVGQAGTAESNQVGLFALESGKNIWNVKLPAPEQQQSSARPFKK